MKTYKTYDKTLLFEDILLCMQYMVYTAVSAYQQSNFITWHSSQCSWVSRTWAIIEVNIHWVMLTLTCLSTHYLPYTYPCTYVCMHTHMYTHTHNTTYTLTWLYTQSGETALYIAVREEREDIVELLLEASADPDVPIKVIQTYHTQQLCYMT